MKSCTRQQAIDDLRRVLVEAAGDEHSVCQVAKERGLFCHGFAQWKLGELRAQYPQITRSRPKLSRTQMEDLADSWQMARQYVTGCDLACDVQMHEGKFQTCHGWAEFEDEELDRFHEEVCGTPVRIVAGDDADDA